MLNYRNIIKFYFLALFLCVVSMAVAQIPYRVIVPVPEAKDGAWVYMKDLDKGIDIDSVQVADHHAVFKGDVDEPYMVAFVAEYKCCGILVLEQGTSTINQASGFGVGTMLNDRLKAIMDNLIAVATGENADQDSSKEKYIDIMREAIRDNDDNPISYFIFLNLAPYISAQERQAMIAAYPGLGDYQAVKEITEKDAN